MTGMPSGLTHRIASVKRADTWGALDAALNALSTGKYKGLGFVLTRNDPICGTDMDGCRNPESGELTPFAQDVVTFLSSYTEISPSGTGLHILTRARLPGQGMKTAIEMYD
jgi:putative DNA primase/helicase